MGIDMLQVRQRHLILAIVPLIMLLTGNASASPKDSHNYFLSLQNRLIIDGFDAAWIRNLYARPEVHFEFKGISLYFVHRESKVEYPQYTVDGQIKKARRYMQRHAAVLADAEKNYGVDRQVVTAIILVETQLGTLMGRRSVLNTLSTMAALFDPEIKEMLWAKIHDTPDIERDVYDRKVASKSEWAYRELKAFLNHAREENFDPVKVKGSFAGAMGIPQFMPSNIVELARDGDLDGRVDLFNHADAIASVASYLRSHGWYPGIDRDEAGKVIYHYNHSQRYVQTILDISEKLKVRA
jgi:membrane-bound lytic murein transglycosylase B